MIRCGKCKTPAKKRLSSYCSAPSLKKATFHTEEKQKRKVARFMLNDETQKKQRSKPLKLDKSFVKKKLYFGNGFIEGFGNLIKTIDSEIGEIDTKIEQFMQVLGLPQEGNGILRDQSTDRKFRNNSRSSINQTYHTPTRFTRDRPRITKNKPSIKSFNKRQKKWIKQRDQSILKQRLAKIDTEIAECTFRPIINRSRIASSNKYYLFNIGIPLHRS